MDQRLATGHASASTALPMTPTQALLQRFEFDEMRETAYETSVRPSREPLAEQQRQGVLVGGLPLMIRYDEGSELAEIPTLYPLPNVPPWFCGFANLQGVLVPVFDLARYLALDDGPSAHPLLLVLSHGDNAAGMLIDAMPQRLRWSTANRTATGAEPSKITPHLRGACLIEERLWFDLDCASLLDALAQDMGAGI